MIKNTTKDTVWALFFTAIFFVVFGGVTYFSYDTEKFIELKKWTEDTFINLQVPFIIVTVVFLLLSIYVNVLGHYIMAMSEGLYKNVESKKETYAKDSLKYIFFIKNSLFKHIFNALSIFGIIGILLAEIYAQGLLAIFTLNFAMEITGNLFVLFLVFLLTIISSYKLIGRFVKWLFKRGLPFFKDTREFQFLREGDEEKIKSWSLLLGGIFTVYTIGLTILGIIDQNALYTLNNDDKLISNLYIGCVGVITFALRSVKGSLRVL